MDSKKRAVMDPASRERRLHALRDKYAAWRVQKNPCACQMCSKCRGFADELDAVLVGEDHEPEHEIHEMRPLRTQTDRAQWLTDHVDRGHSVTRQPAYDECSCGATFWRKTITSARREGAAPATTHRLMTVDEAMEQIGDILTERDWGNSVDWDGGVRAILEKLAATNDARVVRDKDYAEDLPEARLKLEE